MQKLTITARDLKYQGFNPAHRVPFEFETPKEAFSAKLYRYIATPQALPSILIVDLSHWNGDVDYVALKNSGVVAVVLKVSEAAEGTYYEYKDTRFEENWRKALDAGLIIMVYHFFRGEKGSAEFSWFMKCADAYLNDQRIAGKTAVWLDAEWKASTMARSTYTNRAFGFTDLTFGTGFQNGIYSSPGLVPALFDPAVARWNTVNQWNAHWTSASQDTLPTGWNETLRKMWQFGIYPTHSWTPTVLGAGTVDVNHGYWPSAEALRTWLGWEIAVPSESPSASPSPSECPPTGSPSPDCCDEHELRLNTLESNQSMLLTLTGQHDLRLDTLEAGQHVLTTIQNEQAAQINGNTEGLLTANQEIARTKSVVAEISLRITMNEARLIQLDDKMRKIKQAICE